MIATAKTVRVVTQEQLDTPIVDLQRWGLSLRIIGAIGDTDIQYVGDLQRVSVDDLIVIPGLSIDGIRSMAAVLARFLDGEPPTKTVQDCLFGR